MYLCRGVISVSFIAYKAQQQQYSIIQVQQAKKQTHWNNIIYIWKFWNFSGGRERVPQSVSIHMIQLHIAFYGEDMRPRNPKTHDDTFNISLSQAKKEVGKLGLLAALLFVQCVLQGKRVLVHIV
jgi:hypothetical protein